MEKAQVCSVSAILLDDEEEQREKVSRKLWTIPWISKSIATKDGCNIAKVVKENL